MAWARRERHAPTCVRTAPILLPLVPVVQVGVDSSLDAFKAALEGAELEGATDTSM